MMDFQFYQTSVPVDVPVLIVSTVKSITPTDVIVPLSAAASAQIATGLCCFSVLLMFSLVCVCLSTRVCLRVCVRVFEAWLRRFYFAGRRT